MKLDRRNFIGSSAAIAAALSAPTVMAGGKPRVVVVGGGLQELFRCFFRLGREKLH